MRRRRAGWAAGALLTCACGNPDTLAPAPHAPGEGGGGSATSTSATSTSAASTSFSSTTGSTVGQGGGDGGSSGIDDCDRGGDEPERIIDIAAHLDRTIALSSHGRVYCWGDDRYFGGYACMALSPYPIAQVPVRLDLPCIASIETGDDGFALADDGRVFSWGSEHEEERGDGPGESVPPWEPATALLPGPATELRVGELAARATLDDGSLWAWGQHWPNLHSAVPEPYQGPTALVTHVLACLLGEEGDASCMGDNRFGTVGDGTFETRHDLVQVQTDARFIAMFGTVHVTLGVTADGDVVAWGDNNFGSMGIGAQEEGVPFLPTRIEALSGIRIAEPGTRGACALDQDDRVFCWGANSDQMIDGSAGVVRTPVEVVDLGPALRVAAGHHHICSLKTDHTVWCRGGARYRGIEGDLPEDGSATRVVFPFEEQP